MSVLIVEDEADLRDALEMVLRSSGYQVQTAKDGVEALAAVDREMPRLILLDMKMPRMNGWEFAQVFRSRHNHQAPIVVLTAARDVAERAAEIDAEDHLGKPFEIDDLLDVVARHYPAAGADAG